MRKFTHERDFFFKRETLIFCRASLAITQVDPGTLLAAVLAAVRASLFRCNEKGS